LAAENFASIMNARSLRILLFVVAVIAAAGSRLLNAEMGWWNFSPIAAAGLLAGCISIDKRQAFLFTLLAQLVSDLAFQFFTDTPGFYGLSQIFTYAGMVGVTALGTFMRNRKAATVLSFALGGSLVFFAISNLGVWAEGMYGYTAAGFVKTYVMALPFYKATLAGDVVFCALLFGAYELVTRRARTLAAA